MDNAAMDASMDIGSAVGSALALAGAGYAVYGGQLFLRQRAIVFRTSNTLIADPSSLGREFENVYITTSRGTRIHGWWIPGEPGSKMILFFGGSIGNISRELATFSFLLSLGATVFAIDYPGFGLSAGRPGESGCYAAADAAWNYATQERRWSPENIIIMGRSVGVAVAAYAAARYDAAGLVCHSGLISVPDVAAARFPLLPTRYFCYIRFNAVREVARSRCPVLVLHSEEDRVIPAAHGYRIFEDAPPPKRFVELTGDHYGNDWQRTPGLRQLFKALIDGSNIWI
jgi:uncharacterized protein